MEGAEPNFDLWRQRTVEHLIGDSQGGYPPVILAAVEQRFIDLSSEDRKALASRIDSANTITECSSCNSTTSRDRSDRSMTELIVGSPSGPYEVVRTYCAAVLERKRADVERKLSSVREAFDRLVLPDLRETRGASRPVSNTEVGRAFQERMSEVLGARFGEEFTFEVEIPIRTPPKAHRFDLVSSSGSVICECKAYTWTARGSVPSAKLTTLREVAAYLTQVPGGATKVLAVMRAASTGRKETLGGYFVRLNKGLLKDIAVVESDESGSGFRLLHGQM